MSNEKNRNEIMNLSFQKPKTLWISQRSKQTEIVSQNIELREEKIIKQFGSISNFYEQYEKGIITFEMVKGSEVWDPDEGDNDFVYLETDYSETSASKRESHLGFKMFKGDGSGFYDKTETESELSQWQGDNPNQNSYEIERLQEEYNIKVDADF